MFRLVRAIVEAFNDESMGIVTFKEQVEPLRKYLGELGLGIEIAHYWGLRGTNELEDVDNLIVLGTPTENIEEMVAWASALYWDRGELDETSHPSWDMLGVDPRTNEKVEVLTKHYLDPRLEKLLWQGREAELLQAVYRIRPLDDPGKRKAIFVLANTPVPGLEPNVIVDSVSDFLDGLGRPKAKTKLEQVMEFLLANPQTDKTDKAIAETFGTSTKTVQRARRKIDG